MSDLEKATQNIDNVITTLYNNGTIQVTPKDYNNLFESFRLIKEELNKCPQKKNQVTKK